jgi:tetratricopeptide (TPR) repeat protein
LRVARPGRPRGDPDTTPLTPSAAIDAAKDLHQRGDLPGAERLYRAVLHDDADRFDALLLLGILEYQRGNHRDAHGLIERALRTDGQSAVAHLQMGLVLRALRKTEEAIASYDRALAIEPALVDALYNRGNALHALERLDEALESYQKALALQPSDAGALNNRGVVLNALGRPAEALASYDRALAIRPGYAEALNNRGIALYALDRPAEALACYDRALELRRDYAEALNNRGNALRALKRHEQALASYDEALAIDADYIEARTNRGLALLELERHERALADYDQALRIRPDNAEALLNRGNALLALNRHEEALASLDRVLQLIPDHVEALNNRGNALLALNRHAEALSAYEKAIRLRPDDAEAHWNEALTRLLTGDFARGWEKYEWRWKNQKLGPPRVETDKPLWLGREDVAGKTVLIHPEQGLGDAIQFIRYASLVAGRGAKVLVACHRTLRRLFSTVEGVAAAITPDEAPRDFDCHVPLMSLPLAFGTTLETIPARTPYVRAEADEVQRWRGRLASSDRLKVGVAWAGSPKFPAAKAKSCPVERLLPLVETPGCAFFSLQKGVAGADVARLNANGQRVPDYTAELGDFSDTAALVSVLDLVITIDTAIAHLAGALGKPVWIMLPFASDWRWLIGREDSPWYPSARLFRQPRFGDWDSVVQRVAEQLAQRARGWAPA